MLMYKPCRTYNLRSYLGNASHSDMLVEDEWFPLVFRVVGGQFE